MSPDPIAAPAPGPAAPLRQAAEVLGFRTRGRGLLEITGEVARAVSRSGLSTGLATLFCRHTSASLLIQENAARAARADLEAFFDAIAPESATAYAHQDEGPDDMPAHIRSALTGVSLAIPLIGGRLALGTWQGIFIFEHRRAPHAREVALHLIGE